MVLRLLDEIVEHTKFRITPGRFPDAMALMCIHMVLTFPLCDIFHLIRPDVHPQLLFLFSWPRCPLQS